MVIQYINTKNNLASDRLSRVHVGDSFTINKMVVRAIEQAFGKIYCDRFATDANKVCRRFNSFFYEPNCAGVDAFAQNDWEAGLNWVHPPLSLIDKVLLFLRSNAPTATCLILVPKWQA